MLSELNMVGNWFKNGPEPAWKFNEIRFDEQTKALISSMSSGAYEIEVFDHSARIVVKSNGNHCYIPGHYFLYALKLKPFMNLVNSYMKVFSELVTIYSPVDIDSIIQNSDTTPVAIAALDVYSRDNFFKVFRNASDRLGAKSIINNDEQNGKKIRGIDDFFISILLKALPVPDSNSSLLGRLAFIIYNSPEVLLHLDQKYSSSIPYLFSVTDGDELMFRIMTSLGLEGQIDSLLGENTDAEFAAWSDIDRAFLLRQLRESGNEQYFPTPVHYSASLGKYVFIRKNLLDTPSSPEKVSALVSRLWPSRMDIKISDGQFFFKSSNRVIVSGSKIIGGTNKIFYGAPGTGKSYKVHDENSSDIEKIVTVFHPDTQHNDFVGALKPGMEKNEQGVSIVTYQFRPGPFTRALILALSRPDKKVSLIIEEINRGSAAAVFGEIFQLLDRKPDGESTYSINATDPDMLEFINSELDVKGCAQLEKLRIPANLSLLATMNSSDQAVMPLDTAFKRRWNFEYLPIDFSSPSIPLTEIIFATQTGEYSLSWPIFAQIINDTLVEFDIAEDRLIGPFFLSAKELETEADAKAALGGKLFIYLWDDVLRHNGHHRVFSSEYRTFGKLSAAFRENNPVFSPEIEGKIRDKGIKITEEGASQDATN